MHLMSHTATASRNMPDNHFHERTPGIMPPPACKGTTKKGQACVAMSRSNGYCWSHRGQAQ